MDIVVPSFVLTAATVIAAFILNQALAWAGVEVSLTLRKGIVFVVAVALTGYYGLQSGLPLPDPNADLFAFTAALLAGATAVFKAAQVAYDQIWKGLLSA